MPYRQTVVIDSSMEGTGSVVDGYFTPGTYSSDGRYLYEGDTAINEVDFKMTLLSDAKLRLYSCKVYQNGAAFHDFVPCYRKSDGEIGLYDLVSDTFYTNQGSGVFTKGPPLGWKAVKEVYSGSTLIWPSSGGGLLSYQAMVDLGNNYIYDATDELNAHPQEYYNKYNGDGHLYSDSGFTGLGIANEGFYVFTEEGVMTYAEAMDLFGEYRILVYDGTNWYGELVGHEIEPEPL